MRSGRVHQVLSLNLVINQLTIHLLIISIIGNKALKIQPTMQFGIVPLALMRMQDHPHQLIMLLVHQMIGRSHHQQNNLIHQGI